MFCYISTVSLFSTPKFTNIFIQKCEKVTYLWFLCYFDVHILELCLVCASTPYLFFSHNKWTRQILYVVIYFFCNVFLTIHTLIYVITFVLCHHLYLDVCVSTSTEFIKIACILLYTNVFQKTTNYEVFSLLRFLFSKKYIQNR